ncbi:flagellar basal body P-ring formation chaperone FlgA [uncultured Selenomonas sp.]|jgi:flagella basal body P-ring formation protein FlgA|uniref:flagellar basal body P-ring formation chaperone FlgA n=1 Tax=uncultured Selenomonas sp. TaxID=159275 RepID=UPI0025FBD5EB|nr:flagellar basal body P-ring formation chaperone FlgA [uncultured Selenomonas sp.]
MHWKNSLLAVFVLCTVWGGFFCLLPPSVASAYGGGTQAEKYPQRVTAAQFDQYASEKLEEALVATGETRSHDITLARPTRDMKAPPGELICQVDVPNAIRYTGTTPVHVSVYVNQVFYRRQILYYRVTVHDTALVTTRDLKPDETIGAGDVKLADVTVDEPAARYLKEFSEIAGRVPSRFLSTGKPLSDSVLQNARVIEVNTPVTIVSSFNGVEVRAEGTALQRGRIGDRIRVKNTRSGKLLLGTVIDAHTVQVGS